MATLDTTSEGRDVADVVKHWRTEISAARKREKDYREDGEKILKQYDARERRPFNILYSNTETMLPALYSNTPIPVVDRRFKDDDPLGKAAATAGQRVLKFLLDTNLDGYDTYDDAMRAATMNALLPGRGETLVKYDATMGQYAPTEGEQDGGEYLKAELVCCEAIQWNRVLYGYAKKWSKMPWIAYELYIDKDEATERFGAEIAGKLSYSERDAIADTDEKKRDEEPNQGERKTTCIYQIWDKDDRKVKYFSEQYGEGLLKEEDDPLSLSGFFPCPKPLQFVDKPYSLTPTALYLLYQEQAEELNRLTKRIKNITNAIKAKGVYAGDLGTDIKNLLEADDNEFVAADNNASLAAEKGFDNAIWFMPVEKLIVVLRELYVAREQCKQVIYEITGISDILRGATKASETLGAQEIKNQWGTLRLKNKQREVARYAKDLLRLMLELAATKFSEDTWAKMTGLPFTTTAQREKAQMVLMAAQTSGQPPDPQALAILQQPSWSDVLKLLRDDLQRAYRIDIETNSTVQPEAADDHQQITELFGVIGQMLNGLTPLVVQGVLPFQAAQALLLVVARRWRFGSEIEDYIRAMQPPKPPDENGAERVQKEKELAAKELEMQKKQAESDVKLKQMDAEMAVKQKEMDLQMREAQLKVDQDVFKLQMQSAQQQQQMREQTYQAKVGAEEKVRQEKEKFSQREQQVAKQADSKVAQGLTAVQKAAQQVQQLSTALDAIQQQAAETQQLLGELLKVAKAPRIKRAIRGKDNRIERVEEEIAV